MGSDIDLVLLTLHVAHYAETDDWIHEVGGEALLRTATWGPSVERRVRATSGLELELNFAPPYWAAIHPVDAGTRRAAAGGIQVLHDPDGLLLALARAVHS